MYAPWDSVDPPRITRFRSSASCTTIADTTRNSCHIQRMADRHKPRHQPRANIGTTIVGPDIDYGQAGAKAWGVHGEGSDYRSERTGSSHPARHGDCPIGRNRPLVDVVTQTALRSRKRRGVVERDMRTTGNNSQSRQRSHRAVLYAMAILVIALFIAGRTG